MKIETTNDVAAAIAHVTADKRVKKATHPAMFAWRLADGQSGFDDCGEAGAGRRLLQLLERKDSTNTLVAITRWYGGKHLGPSRFRAIANCAKEVLDDGNHS